MKTIKKHNSHKLVTTISSNMYADVIVYFEFSSSHKTFTKVDYMLAIKHTEFNKNINHSK